MGIREVKAKPTQEELWWDWASARSPRTSQRETGRTCLHLKPPSCAGGQESVGDELPAAN